MTATERSVNGVPIRLTDERWNHITESHCELAGHYFDVLECLKEPDAVFQGRFGEVIALKHMGKDKYIAVVYIELKKNDGFVITAFLTKKKGHFERRKKLWP